VGRFQLIILLLIFLHKWAERGALLDPNYFLLVCISPQPFFFSFLKWLITSILHYKRWFVFRTTNATTILWSCQWEPRSVWCSRLQHCTAQTLSGTMHCALINSIVVSTILRLNYGNWIPIRATFLGYGPDSVTTWLEAPVIFNSGVTINKMDTKIDKSRLSALSRHCGEFFKIAPPSTGHDTCVGSTIHWAWHVCRLKSCERDFHYSL